MGTTPYGRDLQPASCCPTRRQLPWLSMAQGLSWHPGRTAPVVTVTPFLVLTPCSPFCNTACSVLKVSASLFITPWSLLCINKTTGFPPNLEYWCCNPRHQRYRGWLEHRASPNQLQGIRQVLQQNHPSSQQQVPLLQGAKCAHPPTSHNSSQHCTKPPCLSSSRQVGDRPPGTTCPTAGQKMSLG